MGVGVSRQRQEPGTGSKPPVLLSCVVRRQEIHAVVFDNDYTIGGEKFLKEKTMSSSTWRVLSNICFVAGFFSVIASIAIWFLSKEPDPAHGERFGIFVGLWAPTFFVLSSRLERYSAPKVTGS